jgi:hypothetical protein
LADRRDFLNMTQFAGFLASSQERRPARSRRKAQHRKKGQSLLLVERHRRTA